MYDKDYFLERQEYSSRLTLLKITLAALKLQKGKKVLDVGCGMGYMVKYLNENGYDVWGVDNAMVLAKMSVAPERLILTNCESLPFNDKEFDIVISSDFLEHIAEEDVDKYVNEMCRVGKAVLARISFRPDKDYHLTIRSKDWWQEKLGDRVILMT